MSARGWKTIKIRELGRVVTGKTPPTHDARNFGNKYPFITPRDMNIQKKIRYTERYLSEKGRLTMPLTDIQCQYLQALGLKQQHILSPYVPSSYG
jgi:hypothetical protein